jgi:Cu+-exporting ATPase
MDRHRLLRLAASLEQASEHPLAAALAAAAKAAGLSLSAPGGFNAVAGKGVTGVVDGQTVALGNDALMADRGIDVTGLGTQAAVLRGQGATTLFAAIDGQAAGVIAIADPIRHSARGALAALRDAGLDLVMLTGDNLATAEAVGRQLGLTDIRADTLPQDKQAVVQKLRAEGRVVAMAGDGVNDAPALAAADVGIAMGTGTEAAMQAAGITLLQGDLAALVRARALSRATMRNIRQNLAFAFAYNAVLIPVAAGVLYPATGLLLSPVIAAVAMSLSSVSVIGNALRLRGARL